MAEFVLTGTASGIGEADVLVDGVVVGSFTSPGTVSVSLGEIASGTHTILCEATSGGPIEITEASALDGDYNVIRATVGAAYDESLVEIVLAEQDGLEAEEAPAADGYEVGLVLSQRQAENLRAFEGQDLDAFYNVGQVEIAPAAESASGPLQDVHIIRATCGAAYDDAAVSLVLAAQVAHDIETALASDGYAAAVAASAGQAEGAVAIDLTLGHRVKVKPIRGPHVPPWWNRHRRGGKLWSG